MAQLVQVALPWRRLSQFATLDNRRHDFLVTILTDAVIVSVLDAILVADCHDLAELEPLGIETVAVVAAEHALLPPS